VYRLGSVQLDFIINGDAKVGMSAPVGEEGSG